jgi:hypothetical protein
MRNTIIVSAIILSFASLAWAEENTITKQAWIEHMKTALPKAFCEQKQYFRQCFKVTEQECLNTAAAMTNMCLNKKAPEMPDILVQPKDGSDWGGKVGECTGESYESALLDKRINSDRCNEVKNWI